MESGRSVRGDGVGGEHRARDLGEDHPLDHDGELDAAVVDTQLLSVRDRAVGEQRRPAPADVLQQRIPAGDVQVGVLLPRERCCRQILGSRAGTHGKGQFFAQAGEMAADLVGDADRDRAGLNDLPDLRTHPPTNVGFLRAGVGQPVQQGDNVLVASHGLCVGVRGDAETLGHSHSGDPGQFTQIGALAAGECELRLVDLLQSQDVLGHAISPLARPPPPPPPPPHPSHPAAARPCVPRRPNSVTYAPFQGSINFQ